jgi:hypothetical protein
MKGMKTWHNYSLNYFVRLNSHSWVMLSLYTAAAEMNLDRYATLKGLRVYGLLTDLQTFHFYSYDQSQRKFAFDETLQAHCDRERFMVDMIQGMWLSHLTF